MMKHMNFTQKIITGLIYHKRITKDDKPIEIVKVKNYDIIYYNNQEINIENFK